MSEENARIVRRPFTVAAHPRRRLEERFALRFRRVAVAVGAALQGLPVTSRLRQAFMRRAVQIGFEATNRGDYEAAFMLYHPDVELVAAPQIVALGLDPTYRGRDARVQFQRDWTAEWGAFQFDPTEIAYVGGDEFLITGRINGAGRSSGATFDSEWGVLLKLVSGQVVEERFYFDRAEALQAAGLSE